MVKKKYFWFRRGGRSKGDCLQLRGEFGLTSLHRVPPCNGRESEGKEGFLLMLFGVAMFLFYQFNLLSHSSENMRDSFRGANVLLVLPESLFFAQQPIVLGILMILLSWLAFPSYDCEKFVRIGDFVSDFSTMFAIFDLLCACTS